MTKKSFLTGLEQQPGESDEAFYKRVYKWAQDSNVRSKADNREWTGSLPFHLNQEPKP